MSDAELVPELLVIVHWCTVKGGRVLVKEIFGGLGSLKVLLDIGFVN